MRELTARDKSKSRAYIVRFDDFQDLHEYNVPIPCSEGTPTEFSKVQLKDVGILPLSQGTDSLSLVERAIALCSVFLMDCEWTSTDEQTTNALTGTRHRSSMHLYEHLCSGLVDALLFRVRIYSSVHCSTDERHPSFPFFILQLMRILGFHGTVPALSGFCSNDRLGNYFLIYMTPCRLPGSKPGRNRLILISKRVRTPVY